MGSQARLLGLCVQLVQTGGVDPANFEAWCGEVHPEAKWRGEFGQARSDEGEPELKPWCHQWDSRFAGGELSCSSADRSVGSVSLRRSGATIQAKRIDLGLSEV